MSNHRLIIYCHCVRAQVTPRATRLAVLQRLCASDVEFIAVADLCVMAGRKDEVLKHWATSGVVILACHVRAVQGLFAAAGASLSEDAVLLDMRAQGAEEILRVLPAAGSAASRNLADVMAGLEKDADGEPAWFPVIDSARCTQCKQCLSFCLFGVYAVGAAGRIQVRNPGNCKPNCPACARVCPELAIIFPKHGEAPINGAAICETDVQRAPVKVDISALLGGNVHQALRERRERAQPRFDVGRNAEQAAEERRNCLARLQQQLDIPAEVLQSLPSAEELLNRAKKAPIRPDEGTQ